MPEPRQLGTSTTLSESPAVPAAELDRNHHYSQLVWRLAASVRSIGSPMRLTDLASQCSDVQASPEFVKLLCSIPNSPILLTEDGLSVTLSRSALGLDLAPDAIARQSRDYPDWNFRKRKLEVLRHMRVNDDEAYAKSDEEEELQLMPLSKRSRNESEEVHCPVTDGDSRAIITEANGMPTFANGSMLETLMAFDYCAPRLSGNPVEHHVSFIENGIDSNAGKQASSDGREIVAVGHDTWLGHPTRIFGHEIFASVDFNPICCIEGSRQDAVYPLDAGDVIPPQTRDHGIVATDSVDINYIYEKDENQQDAAFSLDVGDVNQIEVAVVNPFKIGGSNPLENGNINDLSEKVDVGTAGNNIGTEGADKENTEPCRDGETQTLFLLSNIGAPSVPPESEFRSTNVVDDSDDVLFLCHNPPKQEDDATGDFLGTPNEQLLKPSGVTAAPNRSLFRKTQDLCKTFKNSKVSRTSPQKQCPGRNSALACRSEKQKRNNDGIQPKDLKEQFTSLSSKDLLKKNTFPDFDSYIIEEEEGSGGYGIVYKALRKCDGTKVAIKCPHADAQKHHVSNELSMLERFGGKNFIIKYEGCLKSGNSDCFILEHVEHDRPELLKREIDISQLQWYGYCMFRALASLHKQAVVHRDVKPGNFLFSRRTNKGYLIDFNLAMDLHQKYRTTDKCKTAFGLAANRVNPQNPKPELPSAGKKQTPTKSSNMANRLYNKASQSTLGPNNLKKAVGKIKARNDLHRWDRLNSQGADGSGITSAKDMTSTKNNPSGEKRREPLPRQGNKKLINFLQENMSGLNHESHKAPSSMRKRVAAIPGTEEKAGEILYLTPMPLRSNSQPVAGAGLINKVDRIQRKDSPCAGTKGFRAPEVCFRSPHQGPKIDVWSAGVTLLYLMIGRTPFTGDPEQNIKEIAKLRGSEDLWEVAKLHNRESLFPEELYNTRHLQSMDLREWCRVNTKRKDFLEVMPRSLLDLVDKCLTVNPRLRISAEDALKHEFLYPIQESLRNQRLLKQQQMNATGFEVPATKHDARLAHNMKEGLEGLS